MNESFEQLLKRLSQDQTLFQSVEEAIRQGVILPILAQIGWDRDNV
jgi:predicted type IV restriction endonuclease